MLVPVAPGLPDLTARGGTPPRPIHLHETWVTRTRRVAEEGRATIDQGGCPADVCAGPPQRCAVAVVPIRAAGTLLGALGVAGHACPATAADLALLDAIADQLAVALENTRHFQEERRALAELQVTQQKLEAYLRFAVEAQEEERKRLARELHDDTIQSLVVAKGRLDDLAAGARLSPAGRRQVEGLTAMLQQAVDDIRRFCRDLRPSLLDDLGLVDAVDWLVEDLAARTGIAARLELEGGPERLAGGTEVALYRIVQEALHNVERHAAATAVTVTFSFAPDRVSATVRDDGRGFDREARLAARHGNEGMGLLGMQERARLVGGILAIETADGEGTSLRVQVPRPTCPVV
jgi:signal transduction histidine kinase